MQETKVKQKLDKKSNTPLVNTWYDLKTSTRITKKTKPKQPKQVELLGDIKIARKFAMLIKMGFKTVEVRKLIKGYVEGYYMLVDAETGKDLFVIHLEPHALNPSLYINDRGNHGYSTRNTAHPMDELTWKWVKKNYVKKKIDFIVYKVSIPEVK